MSVVTVRGKKQSAMVMTTAVASCKDCGSSVLIVLRQGDRRSVQGLRLASIGLTLYYAPRPQVDELLAQAPRGLERVPVLARK